ETPAGSNINQAENLGEPIVSTSSPEKPNITSEQQQLTTSQSQNQNSVPKLEKTATAQELFTAVLARVKAKAGVTNAQISSAVSNKVNAMVASGEISEAELASMADLLAAEINGMEFLGVTDNKPNPPKASEEKGKGILSSLVTSNTKDKKDSKPS
ncbi:MAG: hypothetical protein SFT90_08170, partial [Rickettsiales bacterium]|nr:hypothetical protein [Rickettsiales bacterium]